MLAAMLRALLVIAPVLAFASGCSLIFVNGPPEGHERLRYFDCESNAVGPVADASWAVFDGLLAAAAASTDGDVNDNGEKINAKAPAIVFGVAAALHAGSLIYGVMQTGRCSSAKQHLQQRI